MTLTRRALLKAGAGAALATAFSGLPFNFTAGAARASPRGVSSTWCVWSAPGTR